MSCVERLKPRSKENSSYQMLTTDKNLSSYQSSKNLVEKWVLMSALLLKIMNRHES